MASPRAEHATGRRALDTARILVVEDDPSLREVYSLLLQQEGYEVDTAADGEAALAAVEDRHPDLVVMDVLMPVMNGIQACRLLRARGEHVPVMFLTAQDGVSDRVRGLDAGAQDYLVKPFASEELFARVRAVLRDHGPAARQVKTQAARQVKTYADLTLDPASRQVWRGDREVMLTRTEFDILEILFNNTARVLPRAELAAAVWRGRPQPASNSLEVLISGIRRKIEHDGEDRLLLAVHGIGWTLRHTSIAA